MPRIIEIIVSPTGETTVQTRGFVGGDCVHASRWLEDALGNATADRKTSEYFASQPTQQEVQQ